MNNTDLLVKEFSKKIGINLDNSKISENEGIKIITHLISEYQKGVLSLDELSFLCERLYAKFDPLSDLYTLLLGGAELEWYMRWKPEVGVTFLKDLLDEFGTKWDEKSNEHP